MKKTARFTTSTAMVGSASTTNGARHPERSASRRAMEFAVAGTPLLAISLAAALMLTGCGGDGAYGTSSRSFERTTQAVSDPMPVPAPSVEVTRKEEPAEAAAAVAGAPTSESGLPPDVIVAVEDTLVTPGAAVEVTARTTSDVSQLVLWDGLGDREAFTYDPAADVWRARYRVPLKAPWERIGLAVTARNDSDRWRRVWVFLRIGSPEPAAPTEVVEGS